MPSRVHVVAASLLVVSAAGFSGCGGAKTEAPAVSATSPAPSPSASDTDILQAGAKKITVRGDWLSAGEKGVWLSDEHALQRLDPATGKPTAKIPVAKAPARPVMLVSDQSGQQPAPHRAWRESTPR